MKQLFGLLLLSLLANTPVHAQGNPPPTSGTVVAWGFNGDGETNVPAGLSNVTAIAAGHYHTLAVKVDGTVVAWGLDLYGETIVPSGLSNVTATAAGFYHSVALKRDGTVVAWGSDYSGATDVPAGLSNVTAVAAGESCTLALKRDGTVVAWGRISVPSGLSNVTAIAAGWYHAVALKSDGTVVAWGYNNSGQTNVPSGLSNVTAIAAGGYHTVALKSDGTVVAWGMSDYGQTTVPAGLNNVTAITAGYFHTTALKGDGTVVAWGADWYGYFQTDVPAGLSNVTAIAAGGYFNVALLNGIPVIAGQPASRTNDFGTTVMFSVRMSASTTPFVYQWYKNGNSLTDIGNISGSTNSTLILNNVQGGDAGNYLVAIANAYGAVTSSVASLTVIDPAIFAQPAGQTKFVGDTAVFSVGAGGTQPMSYQWYKGSTAISDGGNVAGSGTATLTLSSVLNGDSDAYFVVVTNVYGAATSSVASLTVAVPPPVITQQPTNQIVPIGNSANVGVMATGTNLTYQWFKDGMKLINQTNSVLSFASFQFTNSGSYSVVVGNSGGLAISLPALLSVPGTPLQAWGANNAGQLGNGTTVNTSVPLIVTSNVVAVAAGQYHSLFVESDGTLWAMGHNYDGELGNGNTVDQHTPVVVASDVVAVAAGAYHSLFVKGDGTLWAMGYNYDGELGNGNTLSQTTPVMVASDVVAVAAGGYHSFFIKSDGTLWATGHNSDGEFGNGTTVDQHTPVVVASNVVTVAAGRFHSLFIKSDGTLWTMGHNYDGELGNGNTVDQYTAVVVASNVVAVASGAYHSFFMKSDGTLWAMGHNGDGELGIGNWISQSIPVIVASNVVAVAAGGFQGGYHSLFVKFDGSLWGMGDNNDGQLGNGTTNNSTLPVHVPNLVVASLGAMAQAYHSICVAVQANPVIVVQPSDQIADPGQNATFNVVALAPTPLTYQWREGGMPLVGATNTSLTLTNVQASDMGFAFDVVVSDAYGYVTSSVARLVNAASIDADFIPDADGPVNALAIQPDGKILAGGYFGSLGGVARNALGRLNPDGSVDNSFDPEPDNGVICLAVQPDGKILAGGDFTSLAGMSRVRIGRLNADGTADTGFNSSANSRVNALVVQPDGKILVAGAFGTLGGQTRNRIGRLNANGTVDTSFNPVANNTVSALQMQADGKVLVGGYFTTLGGQSRNHLARLNADGTVDTAFNPGTDASVDCLALQADGKILVGGRFTVLGGQSCGYLGRLNADGTLDTTFNPGADGEVVTLAVQADGKILAGGNFGALGGESRSYLGRLNADGSIDPTFNLSADYTVQAIELQTDGKIVVGGSFSALGEASQSFFGRMNNSYPASESLAVGGTNITWLRGGTSPEVWRTTFEQSLDGTNWTMLGSGTRIAGGWSLSGISVTNGITRARGYTTGGDGHSGGVVERVLNQNLPGIVSQPMSRTNSAGTTAIFNVFVSGSAPFTYQWYRGSTALTDGGNVSGSTSNVLTLTNVQTADATNYFVVVGNNWGSVTSQVAQLTVMQQPPLAIVTTNGTFGYKNGKFQFTLTGPQDANAIIYASPDLKTWTPVLTNPMINGSLIFTDLLSTNFPQRYYRATLSP